MGQLGGHQRMTSLVVSSHFFLFFRENQRLAFHAHENFVFSHLEIELQDRLAVLPSRAQGRFINHVREIGSGETRRAASQY